MVILANSGGGKSWAIRRIAEESVGKVQTIILDPEGEFASLREKHDFILAGKDADVPVEVRSAALFATKLLELNKSAIVDLYELHPQERQRYVKLFCEALVNCPKELYHPVIIILDEAHEYVPEGKPSEATWAVEALSSKGRKRGQCLILASQRISKLSKNAAAECNNKLIGRASQDIDMKRAGDELGFTKDRLVELRQLRAGEFFAFGPAISDEVQKLKVGDVKTTHAKVGYKSRLKPPPPSAVIKKVLSNLKDLPQEAEKDLKTVTELKTALSQAKREITRLTGEVSKNAPRYTEKELRQVLKPLVQPLFDKINEWRKYASTLENKLYSIESSVKDVMYLKHPFDIPFSSIVEEASVKSRSPVVVHTPKPVAESKPEPADATSGTGELTGSEQKVLDAIAWCESIGIPNPEQTLVAFLAGYSNTRSTGYTNPRGAAKAKGLVEYRGDTISLTGHGRTLAHAPEHPLTQDELQRTVLNKLDGSSRKVLEPLLRSYPEPMSNEDLCAAAGYTNVRSTGYTNPRGRLKSCDLVEYVDGGVRARDILFIT